MRKDKDCLTVKEYADKWGVSRQYISRLCKEGRFSPPPFSMGLKKKEYRIHKDARIIYKHPATS